MHDVLGQLIDTIWVQPVGAADHRLGCIVATTVWIAMNVNIHIFSSSFLHFHTNVKEKMKVVTKWVQGMSVTFSKSS